MSVAALRTAFKENSAAVFAFGFLVAVGVSKTLLTKLVFTHSPTPVAFSVLSCIATNLCLTPILIYQGEFKGISLAQLRSFAGICLAIALDLGCQNVALAILSVALQQCIKATSPTATVVVESIIRRKKFHWAIYATVAAICIGPILVASGSSWTPKGVATNSSSGSEPHAAESEAGSQLFGAIMMIVAMVGGAFKYVLCHKAIGDFRREMGVLAFTFWVEMFVAAMLAPWALLNGEAYKMAFETDNTPGQWALLWFTAAFGGVRIISQFYFLAKTSATSLAMSGVAMTALNIIIGIIAFSTPVTWALGLGVVVTIVTSSFYAWLKTSKVLDPEVNKKKALEKAKEIEARSALAQNDSAAASAEEESEMHMQAAPPVATATAEAMQEEGKAVGLNGASR